MAILTGKQISAMHAQLASKTIKAINSDFVFEIEGFENNWMLARQCPWPELSTAGEIEIPGPGGTAEWQPQQAKVQQQGGITLMENQAGDIDNMLLELLVRGGMFNARVYEGTSPDNFRCYKPIRRCFLQIDNPDRDWENRGQVLTFSGTLFFHYYGEKVFGDGVF